MHTPLTPADVNALCSDAELGQLAWEACGAGHLSETWTRLELAVAARNAPGMYNALALQTGTRATTPAEIYRALVVEFARVTDDEARRFGAAVLASGAPVADAAVKLARAVRAGHTSERCNASAADLRRILRDARK